MNRNNKTYYDKTYFSDQKKVGVDNTFGVTKIFQEHIMPSDVVLDFGCGGGFLLGKINCAKRIGFDVNSVALETAKLNGLTTVSSYDDIDDNSVDVVMSNSAIEHTPTPFEDICKLHSKLKVGGKAVFRVPHETIGYKYKPNDWNYHLFTWSPMAIGNLFNEAGYKIISVGIEKGMQPPLHKIFRKIPIVSNLASFLYRLVRLIFEELGIKAASCDGYSILVAEKG